MPLAPDAILEMDKDRLLTLDPHSVGRLITSDEGKHILNMFECYWQYRRGGAHAGLPDGYCTNMFINTPLALVYTNIRQFFAVQMAMVISESLKDLNLLMPTWLISSDHSAAQFGSDVARELKVLKSEFMRKGSNCQEWRGFIIKLGELVLLVEEIVASCSTSKRMIQGIIKGNLNKVSFLPIFATLIHRANEDRVGGSKYISLIQYDPGDFKIWKQESCPLCHEDKSPRIPSVREDPLGWEKLRQSA